MKFLDEAKIFVKSGDGGSGCASFRREKFVEFGGPNGGNGGKGGDIIIKSTDNLNTLIDYKYKQHIIASNGSSGMKNNKTGKNAKNIVIKVPTGTEAAGRRRAQGGGAGGTARGPARQGVLGCRRR